MIGFHPGGIKRADSRVRGASGLHCQTHGVGGSILALVNGSTVRPRNERMVASEMPAGREENERGF